MDESGDLKNVEFFHEMAGFNRLASDAVKKWRFQAATYKGKPIASKTTIAFIFQTPSPAN